MRQSKLNKMVVEQGEDLEARLEAIESGQVAVKAMVGTIGGLEAAQE